MLSPFIMYKMLQKIRGGVNKKGGGS